MSSNEIISKIIFQKYRIISLLSKGSFGSVYQGINIITNKSVAIKVEKKNSNNSKQSLQFEYETLLKLRHESIPQSLFYGDDNINCFLVEEQLGRSLEDLFEYSSRKFSLKTVCYLAIEIINLVRIVHSKNFIHCDIKPANFTYEGRRVKEGKNQRLHLIDFGLSNEYKSNSDNKHIPFKTGYNLIGTAKYCSINSHLGYELSRRDDMESIGYMIIYFLKGCLPWQGLKIDSCETWLEKIERVKTEICDEDLCHGLPSQMKDYVRYVKGLEFNAEPDYDYLLGLFKDIIGIHNFNYEDDKDSNNNELEVYSFSIEKEEYDLSQLIPLINDTNATPSKSQNSTLTDSHGNINEDSIKKGPKKETSNVDLDTQEQHLHKKLKQNQKNKKYQIDEDSGINKCMCLIF